MASQNGTRDAGRLAFPRIPRTDDVNHPFAGSAQRPEFTPLWDAADVPKVLDAEHGCGCGGHPVQEVGFDVSLECPWYACCRCGRLCRLARCRERCRRPLVLIRRV